MINYREEIRQALFQQDYSETNLLLNACIKDDDIPSEEYKKIADYCKRQGFSFGKHFNLMVV